MTKQNPEPPRLPGASIARVTGVSRANSASIAAVAGLSAVVALFQGHWSSAGWASAAVAAAALEWHGQRRLGSGEKRGLAAMIAAQFALLALIWAYAWLRWRHFDADAFWNELPGIARRLLEQRMLASGLDPVWDRPLLMRAMNLMVCAGLALTALLYQGGLAVYYARKARQLPR